MTIITPDSASVEGSLAWLRAEVQARGYGIDTAQSAQNHAINSVYRRVIGMRRWPFLEVTNSAAFNTVVGTESYALSVVTDLMHLDAVRIAYGSERPLITYLASPEFRDYAHIDTDNGTPLYWSVIGGNLVFWPRPDKVYTVAIDYLKRATSLVNDSDVALIPTPYVDVLVWGAIAEMTYRERDPDSYDTAKEEYNTRLADMLAEYGIRQRQTSSTVVKSGFHEQFDNDGDPWRTY